MDPPMPLDATVFVVDDDAQVRDSLALLLATADIEVTSFTNAEDILAAEKPHQPYCVLLDVRLPERSGLEALDRLAGPGSNAVVVIIVTGHGDVPMAVSAMRAGAFHFIEKPFDSEVLVEVVEEALAHISRLSDDQADAGRSLEYYQSLTPREKGVLALLVEGHPSKIIAYKLRISVRTAEHHRAAVMKKMQARTLSHLVRMRLSMDAALGR
jgi:FixJ family two-component response regulator